MTHAAAPNRRTVALVGAGYIADYHARALRTSPRVELRAVCDPRGAAARRLAEEHGIPKVYASVDEMLRHERLDAAHVLTPPDTHVGPAEALLDAGVDVLLEKPLAHTLPGCDALARASARTGARVGTSHNFLFARPYEALARDVAEGRLGRIDQIDVIWNKELGALRGGPFGTFGLRHPSNVLFEVAPHSFAHALHLLGLVGSAAIDDVSVDARDVVSLPRGATFVRRWEIRGWSGATSVRMRFGFDAGYPEHQLHVHGSHGSGHVDFENHTYVRGAHTPYLLDVDRFVNVALAARDSLVQAGVTLGRVVAAKAGARVAPGPFAESIERAVHAFHATEGGTLDPRLAPALARATVELGERVALRAGLGRELPAARTATQTATATRTLTPPPDTLVVGGTGFLGKALLRALRARGTRVRLVARDPDAVPAELRSETLECVRGDFTDVDAMRAALVGIRCVHHLGRGQGSTYADYLRTDVEPTRAFAEACAAAGVERFVYASSIAIYAAGREGEVITEDTEPSSSMLRANPYARSKVENERNLRAIEARTGMAVTIARPGIVLGEGGPPHHWGVAAFPYPSVARLYGDGENPLPIVLVDDVAEALATMGTAEIARGGSYNLCAPPVLTANEYLDALERAAGARLLRVPVSAGRAFATAWAKYALKSIGRDPHAVRPSYEDCDGRGFAARFDASRAERDLGWHPVHDRDVLVREGIERPTRRYLALDPVAPPAPVPASDLGTEVHP